MNSSAQALGFDQAAFIDQSTTITETLWYGCALSEKRFPSWVSKCRPVHYPITPFHRLTCHPQAN